MAKKFDSYDVKDIRDFIDHNIPDDEQEDYKIKKLHKKSEETWIFTRKAFNKWTDENNVQIVGRIRKRQIRYKDYEDHDELVERKRKKKIIGVASLWLDQKEETKKYDVRKEKTRHTVGYAWVGGNKFLRVTTFNFLWLLIPLLIAGIILCLTLFPTPEDPVLDFADGTEISDILGGDGEVENPEIVYFAPYNDYITLTEDQKMLPIINDEVNDNKYYISAEIYVDGEQWVDQSTGEPYETGLIIPGEMITYNLWDQLDAGTYSVEVAAYTYDWATKTKSPQPTGILSTTIEVVK